MDKKVYLKTYGLLYLIVAFFALAIAGRIYRAFDISLLILFPAALVLCIPVTFIALKVMLNKEKKNPYAKLHWEFKQELFKNGYTEKFFELSGKAITAHKNGEKISNVYLNDYVLYTADYYNMMEQYDTAMSYLVLLDEKDLTSGKVTFVDEGMYALMYYGCLMECYRGLNDKGNAINMIERARPVLDRTFKHDSISMLSDSTYYNYYMLIGNYDKASEFVDKLMSYRSAEADKSIIKYLAEADYNVYLGRKAEAIEALKKVKAMSDESGNPVIAFVYERNKINLGLAEEMAGM